MALRNKSIFLYGYNITASNRFITFGTSVTEVGGLARTATLNLGYYSLTSLGIEVVRALTAADPTHVYSFTTNRNVAAGLQNRVTISTNFTYLSIFFGTGNPSNPASLLGFNSSDYTGATTYTGSATSGIVLAPTQLGFSFLPTTNMKLNFGKTNVSASGLKESVVFQLQQFWQVQFKYIAEADLATIWEPWVNWVVQQREIDFTPDVTVPTVFYSGTLDDPSKGLEMNLTEMLPQFPFQYQTPVMKFRVRPSS